MLLLIVLLAQASAGMPSLPKQYEPPANVRCVKDSFGNYTCTDGSRVIRDSLGNVTVIPGQR